MAHGLRGSTLPKPSTAGSYESRFGGYVQTLFRPSPEPLDPQITNPTPTYMQYEKRLEAKSKPQGSEGMMELLNEIYRDHGLDDNKKTFKKYQVYEPKSSAEYYSVMNWKARPDPPFFDLEDPEDVDDEDSDHKTAKSSTSSSISNSRIYAGTYRISPEYRRQASCLDAPHMNPYNYQMISQVPSPYSRPHLVHPRDSRYIGSEVYMRNQRKPDDFFNQCDKLLDKARRM